MWSQEDIVTGERLQALAEVTVVTPPILAFHTSIHEAGVRQMAVFPGTHTEVLADTAALDLVRQARSVFVYTHLLASFFERLLPLLTRSFVLLSHNSDDMVDNRFLGAMQDRRLSHWFTQNAAIQHPKLTPLPIGVANAQWPHGDVAALVEAARASEGLTRRDRVFCNFEVGTNPSIRAPLLARLMRSPAVQCVPSQSFRGYLREMAKYRWCVSPPGNGIDCHRTWEALYVGTVPLVQKSSRTAALFEGLPVLELEDLGELRLDRLGAETLELGTPDTAPCLQMSSWRRRVKDAEARADSQ